MLSDMSWGCDLPPTAAPGAYPNSRLSILSLSKGGWRLRKAAPFDELRMTGWKYLG
jgi:hypothetical protein